MLTSLIGYIVEVSRGLGITLSVFFMTLIISLPLGVVVAVCRISKNKIVCNIAKLYIWVLRGTPLMLQIALVFFGLPSVGIVFDRLPAAYLACGLNYAAYFAEIFRAGIAAVPVGQHEAAQVLGYSKVQTFCKIVFPQMVKHVLPPVTNEVITLVKDTSLAFALAYTEMFTLAKQVAASKASIMPLFVAGIFYYIFNFIVAWLMEKVEKKLEYYR